MIEQKGSEPLICPHCKETQTEGEIASEYVVQGAAYINHWTTLECESCYTEFGAAHLGNNIVGITT